MTTKECRIEKLINLDIKFKEVKKIVKDIYGYEVEEESFKDFMNHIQEYDDINEFELLSILEEKNYKKIAILSMKKLKNEPHYPVCEEISNPFLLEVFKTNNDVSLLEGDYFSGELGECYKVIKYKEELCENSIKSLDLKIACVRQFTIKSPGEDGDVDEIKEKIYDCARFFIDLKRRRIIMFYNEWPSSVANMTNSYTEKKKVFYNLFKKATKGNIISFILSDTLTNYYNDYYADLDKGKSRKVISHVECMLSNEKAKSIKSTDYEYKHERETLDAIKHAVDNRGYHISTIECLIDDKLVRVKDDGSIHVIDSCISKEVLDYVFKEFIEKEAVLC